MNPMPDEYGRGHDGGDAAARRPPARDGQAKQPAPARTAQLVSGDFLLTVNPIDGSEIEPCPPGRQPEPPGRRTPQERTDLARAAGPPVPPGPASPRLPLLERQQERERLTQLLGRGRSVRLTGQPGSGRTALLDAVAADCADLAPDGVVRLSGHRRTPFELLHELFATVYRAPAHRPDRAGLRTLVRDIGAVVVVDDLEFGGAALDELLDATPECAFLLATTPEAAAPSPDAHLEEVVLTGLGRGSTLELLERVVDRPLTDDEANWAGDLWFESEGLPLRFVQAGALLRQRDELRAGPGEDERDGEDGEDGDGSVFAAARDLPLPSLGEGAAPAALLASRLSEPARKTLRFAVALGGEVPHQAHLPALIGDTHADAALGELLGCGLLTPVGGRYRLAAGVASQLVDAGYGEGAITRAHTAAQHYAWWAGHPSVTPERASAEADAVLAAMAALVPGAGVPPGRDTDGEAPHVSAAVLLARSAVPAFAAGLHWGAWERALRTGQEAARIAGEVAEEAYFHHELGVLALCAGNLERARAELEASIALRGALADKRGTVAGRRALALVTDRERGPLPGSAPAGPAAALPVVLPGPSAPGGRTVSTEKEPVTGARYDASVAAPAGVPAAGAASGGAAEPATAGPAGRAATAETAGRSGATAPAGLLGGPLARWTARRTILTGARRNLVAAGAGAVLAAVLGTVVTLGAASGGGEGGDGGGGDRVTTDRPATDDGAGAGGDGGAGAEEPGHDSTRRPGGGGTGGGHTGGQGGHGEGPGDPGSSARPDRSGPADPSATPDGTPSATTTGGSPTTTGGTATSTGGSGTPSSGGSSSPTGGGSGTPTSGGSSSPTPTTSGSGSPTTTGGTTSGGTTTGGTTSGSSTGGGSDSGGSTDSGGAGGGTSGSGTSDGGTTDGGTTDGGTTGTAP
ncbi:ATP-binding protein [Streptomyces sp. NPDC050856]|uniref:ATP-binding protein n=1 Tax=Streptomyces sp. NPDC050856 TaxID=3154939 RepID=UPI00340740EA